MSAYQSALTVLGWCLLDSIWQMAVIWMGYKMITAGNKRISPAGKHNLILLFVFIGTEWFVYSFIHLMNEPSAYFLPGFLSVSAIANQWIAWLSMFYLVILSGRLLQYTFQYLKCWKSESSKSLSPVFQAFADRYSKILRIHRKVQVYVSLLAETAETSRFFKPIILLPVSLISQLSPQQIEAILVHELYHIRRNDYLTNICMSCYRAIFFFNPFAHLFYKELARERELACDDGVLELGFTPDLYAETLFSLEKFRQPSPGFSLAADGNKPWLLMERIRRVLGKPELRQNRFSPLIIITGLTALSLIVLRPSVMVPGKPARIAIQHKATTPARYELVELKISVKIKDRTPKISSQQKHLKIDVSSGLQSSPVAEPDETSDPPDMAYFADNKIPRDYTNQPAADLSQDPVQVIPGSPYVPSVSLAYDAQPVVIAADSMRDILIKNDIRTKVCLDNLKAIANLKELEIQIDKNKQELIRFEIENQKLFLLDQPNIEPLLKKIQKQVESKKIQIDVMRNKLEVSEAEIIHI
jgi:beta-lactamase regulating signal transducer with metallopeptidase domain/cellobiose-specific phosphotransferase system component IIB